jgi:hypothetical protein
MIVVQNCLGEGKYAEIHEIVGNTDP